jgi:hypothetical protein
MRPGQGPRWHRPAPESYNAKYAKYTELSSDTRQVGAGRVPEHHACVGHLLGSKESLRNAAPLPARDEHHP